MKRQIITIVSTLIFLFSCSEKTNSESTGGQTARNFERLLLKYKPISIDTLKVHYSSGDDQKSKYYGISLDSLDLTLFPHSLRPNNNFDQFFACYKFAIDSNKTGLITRTPSMYESSALNILVYDRIADSITYQFEIAEEWGDAGASFMKTSWIFKENKLPRVFTLEDYSYDRSVEDENDTTIEMKVTSYLLSLGNLRVDTLIKNDTLLGRKFR